MGGGARYRFCATHERYDMSDSAAIEQPQAQPENWKAGMPLDHDHI